MRFLVGILLLFVAFPAYAAYSNDSSSVDIDYSGPAEDQLAPPPVWNLTPPGDTGGGSEEEEGELEDSDEITVPVIVVVDNSAPGQGTGTGGESDGGFSNITAEDIINTLIGNQAFSIERDPGGGGWWILRISGEKARAALKARGITKITLLGSFRNKFLSRGDMTIAAASSLLENENLEEIIISLDTLSLSYKARGRLFGVLPWEYPVHISVDPYGTTVEERVSVKFPWYRFFLQTFVSRSALQAQIDQVVVSALAEDSESLDARARLYIAITESIRTRFDTIEGSL